MPRPRPSRAQAVLAVGSAAAYATGYPLALVANVAAGWLLVMLGGVLLVALLAVTIRRVHREGDDRDDRS